MIRWLLTATLLLCMVPGRSQPCQTISAGDLFDVNNWLCDCNILECDSIRIDHAMNVYDTVALVNAVYTEITTGGSLTGDAVVAIAGSLVNHGTIAIDRLATDVDWIPEYDTFFANQGVVECNRLVLFADSTRNTGIIHIEDSLVIGSFRRLFNESELQCRILFGLGIMTNNFNIACDSLIQGRSLYNSGMITCDHLFELYAFSINEGSILAQEYNQFSGSFYNEGDVSISGTTSLGVYGGIQFEQSTNGRLTTTNLYVLEDTEVRGPGSICIVEHSENHGTLTAVRICDLTPTLTEPPYLDVHTGQLITMLPIYYCNATTCATVEVPELPVTNGSRLFPNPTSGLVQVELGAFANVVRGWVLVDALGRTSMRSSAPLGPTIHLDLSGQQPGTYRLVLVGADGTALERSAVVVGW